MVNIINQQHDYTMKNCLRLEKNYLLAQTTTGGTLSFPLSSITREKDSTVLHICVNRMS